MLAVECDGATYHSFKSARDRDRIRQSLHEGIINNTKLIE
ncbi:hypothetical protein [Aliivibrio finisterrensis]